MRLAKEGIREMILATAVLGAAAVGLGILHWALAVPPIVVWIWAISFFRDPRREAAIGEDEMCAPADGTVTEVTRLDHHPEIGGPAVRVGIFLSIFNVHANRAPCDVRVRSVERRPGTFLDARHPESGGRNEANTLVCDAAGRFDGPVVIRQVAGKIARRIICHAHAGSVLKRGERFGMIKFGSRTELIVPAEGNHVTVKLGDKVKAGLHTVVRRDVPAAASEDNRDNHESSEPRATTSPA